MSLLKNEKLIFDNAVLSNFSRIEKIELIFYIAEDLYTTKEVKKEIELGLARHPALDAVLKNIEIGKIVVASPAQPENIVIFADLAKENRLGIGEISAIVLAKELDGVFISDDGKAIKKAKQLGVKVLQGKEERHTIGFLNMLLKEAIINQEQYQEIRLLLIRESFIF